MTTWTKIAKADGSGSSSTINPGNPIGLLLALTYATTSSIVTAGRWKNVSKSSGTTYTKVGKASSTSYTKITKAP